MQQPILLFDDAACVAFYQATTARASEGRYVVELPFRWAGGS